MSFGNTSSYFKVLAAVKYLYNLDLMVLLNSSTILDLASPCVEK